MADITEALQRVTLPFTWKLVAVVVNGRGQAWITVAKTSKGEELDGHYVTFAMDSEGNCFHGHYDMTRRAAINDMVSRAGYQVAIKR